MSFYLKFNAKLLFFFEKKCVIEKKIVTLQCIFTKQLIQINLQADFCNINILKY